MSVSCALTCLLVGLTLWAGANETGGVRLAGPEARTRVRVEVKGNSAAAWSAVGNQSFVRGIR